MSLIKCAYENSGAGYDRKEMLIGGGIGAALGAGLGYSAGGKVGLLGAIPGFIYGQSVPMLMAAHRHSRIRHPKHHIIGMLDPMTPVNTAADTSAEEALLMGRPDIAALGGLRRLF